LESIPCRVFTSSRRPGVLAPGPAPSRFSAPSTTSPRRAPWCDGPSGSVAVPLAGFLGLSAVSWQIVASRPCFMPLPPVGFSLQSVLPRRDRVRLSASLAPLQFSTAVPEVRCARPRPPGFTDSRARGAVAWIPTGARTPFLQRCLALSRSARQYPSALAKGPSAASPVSWASCAGTTPFRRLRLLRSFSPPRVRAQCAPPAGCHRGRCSPGLCPSRALIRSSLGPSHDPAAPSVRRAIAPR